MTNAALSPRKKPLAPSDTSPMQGGIVSINAQNIPGGSIFVAGLSETETSMPTHWGEHITQILDASVAQAFVLHGLVPQDVARSEKLILSEWFADARSEQTYQVRALVTGETLNIGTPGSLRHLEDLNVRTSVFERGGVDLTFRTGADSPMTLLVDTSFYPRFLRYFVGAQPFDLSGKDVRMPSDSTELEFVGPRLEREVVDLLWSSRGARFEEGMESNMSRALVALLDSEGKSVLLALARAITKADANVVAEILRTVARLEGPRFADERRWLLEAGLSFKSPLVRDVAVSSLATVGDRRSIPALRRAIAQERIAALRADMEELVRDLEGEPRAKAS